MRKRILLALLAVLMLVALVACTGAQTNTPSDDPTVDNTTAPVVPEFQVVEPSKKNGAYLLTEPGHLLYMAEHPDKNYALGADIDMCGYEWTPIDNFSGTLTGELYDVYNYTISNMTIKVASGETDVGFFRQITGTVKEINFDSITITAPDVFSGNLGIVAGQCSTVLTDVDATNCTVTLSVKDANLGLLCGKTANMVSGGYTTGEMNITLAGGTSYVGGAIGLAESIVMNQEARTDLNITGTGSQGAAGGMVGCMANVAKAINYGGKLKINTDSSFAAGALVGELTKGGLTDSYNCARATEITGAAQASEYVGSQASGVSAVGCLTRDLANLDEKLPAAEQALRQKVVDYMYKICTVRWIPSEDMFFQDDCSSNRHKQSYKAGEIYIGMPYGHDAASLEKFMTYLDENGKTTSAAHNTNISNPYTGVQAYGSVYPTVGYPWTGTIASAVDVLGNDCADAVYWAWSQIEADMDYVLTRNMICTNGMLPVGDYEVTSTTSTAAICTANGQNKIYEAYAKLQKGDAVLNGPGHVRMAAEAAYVFRNADGSINGDKSYLLIHEQGAGCTTLDKRHTTCATNSKFTFSALFKANYIPITIGGFEQGADQIQVSTTNTATDKTGLAAGKVSSNYRLNWVTVQVLDANGAAVVNKKVYVENNNEGTYKGCYDNFTGAILPQLPDGSEPDWILNANSDTISLEGFAADIAAANLTAGAKYTYKVLVGVASQEVEVQSFEFTA